MWLLRRAPRLTAIGLGLLPLLGLELALRVVGVGDYRSQPDAFAGFSRLQPAFQRGVGSDGRARWIAAEDGTDPTRSFLAEKPANGFRVFVFGGSSEAGTPYGYAYSFAALLESQLRAALPAYTVEVVNCAAPGYASRRLLYLAREVARFEPDLFVVSTGHNEVVEQRLYAHLFDYPPWLFELRQQLRRLRLVVVLEGLVRRVRGADRAEVDARELYVPVFGPMATRYWDDAERDPERQRFYALSMFETNVEGIVRAGQEAGARVLLLSQSKNYADWPVTLGRHGDLDPDELRAFEAALERADAAQGAGDRDAARTALEAALALDPGHGPTWQRLADLHREAGRFDAARAAYERAQNTSLANFGTTPGRNARLRALAREHGALWLDAAHAFEEASPHGLVGFELFVDFLHPSLAGHRLLAQLVLDVLRDEGIPEPASRWREVPPLPTPEEMLARDPALRGQELRIRIVAEVLSDRRDAAARYLDELRAVAPDDPQLPRLERWLAGELPFDFKLMYRR